MILFFCCCFSRLFPACFFFSFCVDVWLTGWGPPHAWNVCPLPLTPFLSVLVIFLARICRSQKCSTPWVSVPPSCPSCVHTVCPLVYACTGGTWEPLTPPLFPYMICEGHVSTSSSLPKFPPHTTLPKLCPANPSVPLFALLCVCWVTMHIPASIRTHPHPPESLITPLCLNAHVCVFREISRPCMHRKPTLYTHFCLVFSCFFLCFSVVAPHRTHLHPYAPYAPVHTRPHPSAPQIHIFMYK